jgi:hypothetical protein
MEMVPIIHRPPAGKMVIAVSPDGTAHPLPQAWSSLPNDPLGGIERAAQSSYPGSRIEFVDEQPLEGLAPGKRAEWRDGLVIEDDADKLAAHRAMLARDELKQSDYIPLKGGEEARIISDEWKVWRATLRAIANGSGAEIPAMPYPWAKSSDAIKETPLPAPSARMADWGDVGTGYEDITGDMLLDAFEDDEVATAAVVQTLTALKLKHLSEQLNVEKARLRREHMLTDQADPREANIDRLLGLLTRRGEV